MLRRTNKSTATPDTKGGSKLQLLVILLVFFVALLLIFGNRRSINDWWQLRNYSPTAAVASIANQDTLTDEGRNIFYVNHPQIESRTAFVKSCPSGTREQTIVLGCYHSDQAGIFLLDVTDSRLNGVKQVTAAHEMLHAAYDRLSSNDRAAVDKMLLDYYHHGLTDERIKSTINAYKKTEPNDVVNEMHSIFGTEVAKLPPNLEQHYQRYFKNRAQVVAFSTQYQEEFTSRQAAVDADDAQLKALRAQIDAGNAELKARLANINSQQASLLALRNSGNTAQYNAGVPAFNALVDSYNQQVEAVRGLVNQYNQLVIERNAIALEEDQLVNSLSAQATPINAN